MHRFVPDPVNASETPLPEADQLAAAMRRSIRLRAPLARTMLAQILAALGETAGPAGGARLDSAAKLAS